MGLKSRKVLILDSSGNNPVIAKRIVTNVTLENARDVVREYNSDYIRDYNESMNPLNLEHLTPKGTKTNIKVRKNE